MEEQFERLTKSCEAILSGTRPHQKTAVQEAITLWKTLHDQGVPAYDFSHALMNVAENVMLNFDTLEEALEFGKAQKEAGESMIRAVSEHWPPIDPNEWPEGV